MGHKKISVPGTAGNSPLLSQPFKTDEAFCALSDKLLSNCLNRLNADLRDGFMADRSQFWG